MQYLWSTVCVELFNLSPGYSSFVLEVFHILHSSEYFESLGLVQ
jgi:hypothetical protein